MSRRHVLTLYGEDARLAALELPRGPVVDGPRHHHRPAPVFKMLCSRGKKVLVPRRVNQYRHCGKEKQDCSNGRNTVSALDTLSLARLAKKGYEMNGVREAELQQRLHEAAEAHAVLGHQELVEPRVVHLEGQRERHNKTLFDTISNVKDTSGHYIVS